jgi:hypothetical protein
LGDGVRAAPGPAWRKVIAILLAGVLTPMRLFATDSASDSSLLVFPSVLGTKTFAGDRAADSATNGRAVADVLYTLAAGRLRFLAEADISTDHAEVDRFQVGWEPISDSYIWLGKFHEPSSSWNFERDHGHYLQTAISTPAIETSASDAWGDDAGILPENVTGVLLDTSHPIGGSAGVQLSLGVGVTSNPVLNGDDAYGIRPLSGGRHRVGWNARLSLLPDISSNNGFGLLASKHRVDTSDLVVGGLLDAGSVNEVIYGAYGDGDWGPWSLHATVYRIDFDLRETVRPRTEHVVAGYAQLERRFGGRYTGFARFENTAHATDAEYIQVLDPRFEVRRLLAGLRWDFIRHQALTVELARVSTLTNRFTDISLQWSALIP